MGKNATKIWHQTLVGGGGGGGGGVGGHNLSLFLALFFPCVWRSIQ